MQECYSLDVKREGSDEAYRLLLTFHDFWVSKQNDFSSPSRLPRAYKNFCTWPTKFLCCTVALQILRKGLSDPRTQQQKPKKMHTNAMVSHEELNSLLSMSNPLSVLILWQRIATAKSFAERSFLSIARRRNYLTVQYLVERHSDMSSRGVLPVLYAHQAIPSYLCLPLWIPQLL